MRVAIDLDGPIAQHSDAKDWWKPEHWLDLKPTAWALQSMRELRNVDGHDLTIVTARQPHENTAAWLNEHEFNFPIAHTPRKWEVMAHVYLDDSVSVLKSLRDRRLTCVKWVTKNNIGAAANFSVSTWPEFVALVRSGQLKGKLRRRPRAVR